MHYIWYSSRRMMQALKGRIAYYSISFSETLPIVRIAFMDGIVVVQGWVNQQDLVNPNTIVTARQRKVIGKRVPKGIAARVLINQCHVVLDITKMIQHSPNANRVQLVTIAMIRMVRWYTMGSSSVPRDITALTLQSTLPSSLVLSARSITSLNAAPLLTVFLAREDSPVMNQD